MTAAAPDFSQLEPLPCPLCAYDLRACAGPRCPECGGAFAPAELRAQVKQTNRLLFEHATLPGPRAWLRSARAMNRPTRFWQGVRPAHAIRPRRLIGYWLIGLAVLIVTCLVATAASAARPLKLNYQFRSSLLNAPNSPRVAAARAMNRMTVQQIADRYYPLLGSGRMYRSIWLNTRLAPTLWLIGWCIVWPWLTLATLMIFHWSFRKARLRREHLLRIVIYCSAVWPTVAVVLLTGALALTEPPLNAGWPALLLCELAAGCLLIVTTWRLSRALRWYLGFDHSAGVAISVQVIVVLSLLCATNSLLPWNEHYALWRALLRPF